VSRFSQAVSEGDGISVIPVLRGDVAALALAAETGGAEAVAVASVDDVEAVRAAVGLPVLLRSPVRASEELLRARDLGADACVLSFEELAREGDLLEELSAEATRVGFETVLDVGDEEELADGLERVDPDVVVISEREHAPEDEELERVLDLLPDVPVGKLVIADARVVAREQVLALERAGVDAVIVHDLPLADGFAAAVAALAGRSGGE
jgi:indole-3-glycerol phosphate synthase